MEIDLAFGMRAEAVDIELSIGDVLDRRLFSTDVFPLGDGSYALSNVYAPCGTAQLSIAGAPVAGVPEVDRRPERPTSSAFLAVAEVWSRSTPQPAAHPRECLEINPERYLGELKPGGAS